MSLEEVAKRAGVSTATVSRVLNNLEIVRPSTKARVLKAIAELNYQPNLHARTLAGGRSNTIGMIASNLENPFFFDVFRSLEARARLHGYEVVVAHTDYDPERLVRSVRLMIGRRVAGLAVVVSEMDPALMKELHAARTPCVFYDVGKPHERMTNIRVNYRHGIERLVEYLHDLGHRRLAFVGHHTTLAPTSERATAFVSGVRKFSPEIEWRTEVDRDGLEGGRMAALRILAAGFQPTAIVCVNDFMAAGVMRALREKGLRIPEDVSVTGFDNVRLAEFCEPPLTTVHIPRDEVGRLAFAALVPDKEIPGIAGQEIVIEPEVVLRSSTARAKH